MTTERVTVQNGHHVSTVVVKSDNHVNVVHVYHQPTEVKKDDSNTRRN